MNESYVCAQKCGWYKLNAGIFFTHVLKSNAFLVIPNIKLVHNCILCVSKQLLLCYLFFLFLNRAKGTSCRFFKEQTCC